MSNKISKQPMQFTDEELQAIGEGLNELILSDFPESDDDPIVTAFEKVDNAINSDCQQAQNKAKQE